eukprot:NODE_6656_length_1651_cov_16.607612.p1 GENE.NODE_6656_length_1651_cov_16.607612~~NODE_6656_length_1651_cov_16.607612.p1  ORF type:complete len:283 (-),score=52.46 NODE_6656_length_1651_cov_16.607612:177-1025(-)
MNMAAAFARSGYAVAALNMRGCGDCPLKTARTFSLCRGATDDVRTAVRFIRQVLIGPGKRGVETKVCIAGWCAGASVAVNALAEQTTCIGRGHAGPWTRIDAGIAFGTPHDISRVYRNLESGTFKKGIYNTRMVRALLELLTPVEKIYRGGPVPQWPDGAKSVTIDYDLLRDAQTIGQVDKELTCKIFDYESVEEYCYDASCFRRLGYVNVPLLLMNSADDPIVTSWIPISEVRRNPRVVLAYTAHGGHMVWHDLQEPRKSKWAEAVACDFLDAAVQSLVSL